MKRARPTTVIYVDPGTGKFINANAILRKEATDGWRVEKREGERWGKGGRETNGGVKRFGTRYVNTDVTGSSHGIRIQAKFDFSSRYRVFREWKIVEIYFSRKLDAKKSWLRCRCYRLSIKNILMKFNIFFLLTLSVYFTMSGLLRYWSQK